MEVLRVPPYPITTTWTLPIANYTYIQYVEDLVDHSVEEIEVTSDANGVVEYILPLSKVQFDRKFLIKFYDSEHEHTLYEENLDVIRPYTDPSKLGTTASEIEIAASALSVLLHAVSPATLSPNTAIRDSNIFIEYSTID